MIKIGSEKLFTMTELLENLAEHLRSTKIEDIIEDIKNGACDFEISVIAGAIGESVGFVRGFVTSRREG